MMMGFMLKIVSLLCFVLFSSLPLYAQEAPEAPVEKKVTLRDMGEVNGVALTFLPRKSGSETVGMSFYKNAGTQPDIKDWGSKTPETLKTPPYDREETALKEFNRLQNEFVNFEADTPIVIQYPVDLSDYSSSKEELYLLQFHERTYFPYNVFETPIALLVKDIALFRELPVSGREAEEIFGILNANRSATMSLSVVPVKADAGRVMRLSEKDKTEYYPMLVKPVQFSLWTNTVPQKPLWVWQAEGYQVKQDKDLLNLKK